MLSKETREAMAAINPEAQIHDPVAMNYEYRSFVSRSKGIRNGKRRIRTHLKEVELVSYKNSGFHQWQKFPFDETATETLPGWEEWRAIEHIQNSLRGQV